MRARCERDAGEILARYMSQMGHDVSGHEQDVGGLWARYRGETGEMPVVSTHGMGETEGRDRGEPWYLGLTNSAGNRPRRRAVDLEAEAPT